MKEEVDFTALRCTRLINEIGKITELDLSYKYRIALIERIIDDWREDDAVCTSDTKTSESQEGKS